MQQQRDLRRPRDVHAVTSNDPPRLLRRWRKHPMATVTAVASFVILLAGLQAAAPQLLHVAKKLMFWRDDRPGTSELDALGTANSEIRFLAVLGEDLDPASVMITTIGSDGTTRKEEWTRRRWEEKDRYVVEALIDREGNVRGYGVRSLSDDIHPAVPILSLREDRDQLDYGKALRKATFAKLVPRATDTRTTLTLVERDATSSANTTAPRYVEHYETGTVSAGADTKLSLA